MKSMPWVRCASGNVCFRYEKEKEKGKKCKNKSKISLEKHSTHCICSCQQSETWLMILWDIYIFLRWVKHMLSTYNYMISRKENTVNKREKCLQTKQGKRSKFGHLWIVGWLADFSLLSHSLKKEPSSKKMDTNLLQLQIRLSLTYKI